jgi:sialate O-acetylesterase
VRYAWAANPTGANLVNSEGLPTSIFRTDDWDDVEPKVVVKAPAAPDPRRAQANEIKALNAKLATMDRKSPEAIALRKKVQDLLADWKASAPKK